MTIRILVRADGTLELPASERERLGVPSGGEVLLPEPVQIEAERRRDRIAEAQALVRQYAHGPEASVDAFLARRRADSGP